MQAKGIDAPFGRFFPSRKPPVTHDKQGPIVVGVMSSKGGATKSTVVVHLAIELARRGKKTLIVDTDTKQPTATQAMLNRAQNRPRLLRERGPAFRSDEPMKLHGRLAWAAKEQFDYVVLDVAGRDSANLGTLVGQCTLILVPAQPSEEDLRETSNITGRARVRGVPAFILLARVVNERAGWVIGNIATFCKGAKLAPCVIHQSTIYPRFFRAGLGVTETRSKTRPAGDFVSLGSFVITQTRKSKDVNHVKNNGL